MNFIEVINDCCLQVHLKHFTVLIADEFEGDEMTERKRIEEHFKSVRQRQTMSMMNQLTAEQQSRIDDVIERQTQEMLLLIDKQVNVCHIIHIIEKKLKYK